MYVEQVYESFCRKSPATVMYQGIMEHVFPPNYLDELFRETAERQVEGELLFSLSVETLALAVTGNRKSINAAYQAKKEDFEVSVTSLYNKLKGVETQVSRELVRRSAQRIEPVLEHLYEESSASSRYRVRIVDGNHLAATQRRLKELREKKAKPLPGLALVVLDPKSRLVVDVVPCEDGHAQERSLLGHLIATVEPDDLWIGDRNFCCSRLLVEVEDRKACFLVRQHGKALSKKELVGDRYEVGKCSTGTVYEQQLTWMHEGERRSTRRITVELKKATSRGDTEIHLLSNCPMDVCAIELAELYLQRWTIENVFQELQQSLEGEIDTLTYPHAALLAFCIALSTYNMLTLMKYALAAAHKDGPAPEDQSTYYLAEEISAVWSGMTIAIPRDYWHARFASLAPKQMAKRLVTLAKRSRPDRFRKRKRKTRNPTPKRRGDCRDHVSTARILAARKAKVLA